MRSIPYRREAGDVHARLRKEGDLSSVCLQVELTMGRGLVTGGGVSRQFSSKNLSIFDRRSRTGLYPNQPAKLEIIVPNCGPH